MGIEERAFDLMRDYSSGFDIVDRLVEEFDVDRERAWDVLIKVTNERGSPNLEELRRVIERMGRIRFV